MTLLASMPSLPTAALGLPFGRTPQRSRVSRIPGNCAHSEVPSVEKCSIVSLDLDNIAAFNAWSKATMLPSEKSVGCSTLWIIEKASPVIMQRDQLTLTHFNKYCQNCQCWFQCIFEPRIACTMANRSLVFEPRHRIPQV